MKRDIHDRNAPTPAGKQRIGLGKPPRTAGPSKKKTKQTSITQFFSDSSTHPLADLVNVSAPTWTVLSGVGGARSNRPDTILVLSSVQESPDVGGTSINPVNAWPTDAQRQLLNFKLNTPASGLEVVRKHSLTFFLLLVSGTTSNPWEVW